MKAKVKKQSLEEKWQSYVGTGITASKGKDAIALRQSIGGNEFAVVRLTGGCWTNSPMKVLEEIGVTDKAKAKRRFLTIARKLGFKPQPIRDVVQHILLLLQG